MSTEEPIALIDLAAQQRIIRGRIDAAIARVLEHGVYIMGPEVHTFEKQLATFCGARHAIGCANGTDAIVLALMALKIGPGDVVLVPSFTFAATAEAVVLVGAVPLFVDSLPDTFNMSPVSLLQGIAQAQQAGLRARAVLTVDLFGLPADYTAIEKIAADADLVLICDSAQSFGATHNSRKVGSIGHVTTTSFFPAKPLGCYGDGGAIFTDDDDLAGVLRSLLLHGKGSDKYDNVRVGLNSRLDTLQAAILIEKLAIFPAEIEARGRVANRYAVALSDHVEIPQAPQGLTSVWAQYTLRVPAKRRNAIVDALKSKGIPTALYYPKPLHQQGAYRLFPAVGNGLGIAERLAREVLSLPMHPYIDEPTQDRVIEGVLAAVQRT